MLQGFKCLPTPFYYQLVNEFIIVMNHKANSCVVYYRYCTFSVSVTEAELCMHCPILFWT